MKKTSHSPQSTMTERFEPLRTASLWRRQNETYERLGQTAWSDALVPWRITTCPWLADAEAGLIAQFAKKFTEPLTVWDCGAGTGRAAFHLARALGERSVDARFLLTDVAQSNVEAWQHHPQLEHFEGQAFDVLHPRALALGPTVILAHYLFDSLPHSAWRRGAEGHVQEGWVAECADGSIEWQWHDAEAPARTILTAEHLFPDGAMTALQTFANVTGHRFMVIAVDKGAALSSPTLARHESISAGVNFEALESALPAAWQFASTPPSPVLQLATISSTPSEPLPDIQHLLALINRVSAPATSLTEIIALQTALHDDPDTLAQLAPVIRTLLPLAASQGEVEALVACIARAAQRHFVFKQQLDVPFELATLAHSAGALMLAEHLYLLALRESGERASTLFNLAIVFRATKRQSQAEILLRRTLELDPEHSKAKALLSKITRGLQVRYRAPLNRR